jgi:phosphoribosylamine--glycine ligase
MEPTIEGIKKEGMKYIGVIFFGLMINDKGVYLLEYNVRMGDPETQAVLPLMESDLMDVIVHSIDGNLQGYDIKWKDKYACSVVAASHGYPGKYDTGFAIEGINADSSKVFIAGARMEDGTLKTSGGRVLAVTTLGDTSEEARRNAYASIDKINFKGMYYRKDIGVLR